MAAPDSTTIGNTTVSGLTVDRETRCAHYDSERDVVAIRFACCGEFFPCYRCHDALVDHEPETWSVDAFDEPAVLCGVCSERHSIETYLDADDTCPACGAAFNPGCRKHRHLYFDVPSDAGTSGTQ